MIENKTNSMIEFKKGQSYIYERVAFVLGKIEDTTWWMFMEDSQEMIRVIEDRTFKIVQQ